MTEIRPEDKISGVLDRTIYNLEFINEHCHPDGPFEVVQLVNSFMGAAIHPWENLLKEHEQLVNLSENDVNWPPLTKANPNDDDPIDFHEQLAWIRHAFAHGNIEYVNAGGKISGIDIRNSGFSKKQNKRINWGTHLDIDTLGKLLNSYCAMAHRIDKDTRDGRNESP